MKKKDWQYYKNRLAKIRYYIGESFALKLPVTSADDIIASANVTDEIMNRVNYYCKLSKSFRRSSQAVSVGGFKKTKSFTYYADTKRVIRRFSKNNFFDFIFGDVIHIPDTPTFVKSRPISDDNENSVLLKLNAVRHYQFINDDTPFEDKKPQAVWRGMVHHQHRKDFVDLYYGCVSANIGHNDHTKEGFKGFLSIKDQLRYKYIVSIEGKDVATNLKWAMNSNSLVMMRKPRFETWFMEGLLKPDFHYVKLKDDFSDLKEKIDYYNENPNEAKDIIKNAKQYVKQFLNKDNEDLISVLVASKYFDLMDS
ncbi:glycosyl transferase family 90 [Marinomonas posidonica]|uniref:Lipopolysaccharide-modifying protein n=1 Tax=Marinomonas posidonica (strain CECT 7376 / NCIMB 14433 / IVIA-Po-181) TaxID=491952 RepID=F6CS39_MARPP|nr:glycosyl transferase family 90 [Marinomonas posidonica]AEF53826.1 lipopolysaccharide-modifying protein [Marinomonas posidonica IVIA-Po-181]